MFKEYVSTKKGLNASVIIQFKCLGLLFYFLEMKNINLGVEGGGAGIIIWKTGKVGGGGVFAISLFLGIQRFLSCSLYYYYLY